jgi:hypothetical protein
MLRVDGDKNTLTIPLAAGTVIDATTAFNANNRGRRLSSDKTVTFIWASDAEVVTVRAWKDVNSVNGTECVIPVQDKEKEISFSLGSLDCEGPRRRAVVIQVANADFSQVANFYMAPRWAPNPGSDVGVALTLVDRWRDPVSGQDASGKDVRKRQGYFTSTGLNAYYAVGELWTAKFRPIIGVNLLNFDSDEKTVEMGISSGLLWKLSPLTSADSTGLGLAVGVGYNLMESDHTSRWYSFVGFSINFQQKK